MISRPDVADNTIDVGIGMEIRHARLAAFTSAYGCPYDTAWHNNKNHFLAIEISARIRIIEPWQHICSGRNVVSWTRIFIILNNRCSIRFLRVCRNAPPIPGLSGIA